MSKSTQAQCCTRQQSSMLSKHISSRDRALSKQGQRERRLGHICCVSCPRCNKYTQLSRVSSRISQQQDTLLQLCCDRYWIDTRLLKQVISNPDKIGRFYQFTHQTSLRGVKSSLGPILRRTHTEHTKKFRFFTNIMTREFQVYLPILHFKSR